MEDGIKVKGSFRVHLVEDDPDNPNGFKVVGDSGWVENTVVNLGFNDYIVQTMGALAGSKRVTHFSLGTGGAPAAADTTIAGEINHGVNRRAVTAASSTNSKKLRYTGTAASANSFNSTTINISNIGIYNTSTTNVGTMLAGNTFASSAWATNQSVNITYDLDFS